MFLLYLASYMPVSLTIIRYPMLLTPFAFFAMAVFRLPLMLNKSISFYKLMGCGKNGTFDKSPDFRQWAILAVHEHPSDHPEKKRSLADFYGRFISSWLRLFQCESFTVMLQPLEGHGLWDGKKVFGELGAKSSHTGPIATLTRATIRISKLSYFWQHVAPVASQMATAKGFITSVGIGEVPWLKQATFSIWESKEDMKAFAYGMKAHADVIKKTRQQDWYSEDMFVRFAILGSSGTIRGINPLEGKL